MKRKHIDMLSGPLFPNIIRYTIPIILTSVFQLMFHAADLIVVGQFCGSRSVAAVGATFYLTTLLVNFFTGISIGAGVSTAQGIGSNKEEQVHKTVHTAIPMALVSSMILTILGVGFSDDFLRMMGTPENVLPLSVLYMRIYFCGITFNLLYNFSAAILRAAGDTRGPMIYLTSSGITNVVLNVVFVTVFHMDVAGVALATTLSQGLSAVLTIGALMRRNDACKLHWNKLRFHRAQVWAILKVGLPAGIQSTLFSISNVLSQAAVNSFGDVFISGNAAATNLEGFVYVSVNAFQQTAVNFIGQNAGADQYARIKKTLLICLALSGSIGLAIGVTFNVFGVSLLSLYIPGAAESIAYGLIRLQTVVLPYFLHGLMDVFTGALRGMGYSFTPMVISILGVCGLRITWLLTIFQNPQFHTPHTLYLSYPVSWIVTTLCQLTAFIIVYRKQRALSNQRTENRPRSRSR